MRTCRRDGVQDEVCQWTYQPEATRLSGPLPAERSSCHPAAGVDGQDGRVRLTSTDGAEIELRPLGYQYPSIGGSGPGDWDANWLYILGDVRLADGKRWHFQAACRTTWEAAELAGWLRLAAAGEVSANAFPADEEQILVFTEPNLGFSLAATAEGSRSVRVHFSLEARPRWAPEPGEDGDLYDFFVTLTTTVPELLRAAEEWDSDRALFPPR